MRVLAWLRGKDLQRRQSRRDEAATNGRPSGEPHQRQVVDQMDVTVTVTVPEGALSALRQGPREFAEEMKRAAVAKWYELGVVSQSKGAEILGVSRSEFLDLLSKYRVTPYQVDDEDLAGERLSG